MVNLKKDAVIPSLDCLLYVPFIKISSFLENRLRIHITILLKMDFFLAKLFIVQVDSVENRFKKLL